MSLPMVLDPEFCARLALTLAHFLWEGGAIALAAALVSLALRKASSKARYAVWVAALGVMAVSLPATYGLLEPATVPPQIITAAVVDNPDAAAAQLKPPIPALESSHTEPAPSAIAGSQPASVARQIDWRAYAPYVVLAYLAGVAAMLLRVALAMGGGRRLRRRSEPVDDSALLESLARQAKTLGLRFTPAAAYCKRIAVPTVVGVIKPAILLPLSLMSGLTPQQIDLLLLHELTHIRRYDPLVNVLQRVVEAMLFFHPAVWYVSSQIRIEREHCCDDLVAAHGGAHAYAESLVMAAALASGIRPSSVGGVAAFDRPSQLRRRIARLLGTADPHVRLMRGGWLLAVLAAPLLAVVIANAASTETPTGLPKLAGTAFEDGVAQLKDPDWWLRKVAAQQLGESESPDAVDPLIGALKDEDPRVQATAARALAKLANPRSIKHLVAALKEPSDEVRNAAAEALMKFNPDEVMPLVRVAARDDDAQVQLGAVAVLTRIKPPDALDLMVAMLPRVASVPIDPIEMQKQGSPLKMISKAMEEVDRDRAVELLKQAATSPDPAMRKAVTKLLAVRPFAGTDAVLTLLAQDPAERSRILEIVSNSSADQIKAGMEPAASALEVLKTFVAVDDVKLRATALQYASRLLRGEKQEGIALSPVLIEMLSTALKDDRGDIMAAAASGLAAVDWVPPTPKEKAYFWVANSVNSDDALKTWESQIAPLGQDAKEAFLHALKAEISPVDGRSQARHLNEMHSYAAFGLGKLQVKEAVPGIIAVLSEPDSAYDATRALGEIGDPAAFEAVLGVLHGPDQDADIRAAAITALGGLKDPRAVPVLLDVLDGEQDASVAEATAAALSAIGDRSAVPGLVKLLSSENRYARVFALTVLGTLNDPSVVPVIVDLMKVEQNSWVKATAATALGSLGDPAGAETLTQLAVLAAATGRGSNNDNGGGTAVNSLAQLSDAGVPGLIRVLGQAQNDKVRALAAKKLGEMNSVAAVKALGDAISLDPSGEVSSAAALALGRINDPSAVQALVDALDALGNKDLFLHRADAPFEALALSKEPSSTEAMAQALAKCLNNPRVVMNGQFINGELILQLAKSLADRGDLRAKPVLEKLSENPGTRMAAVAALAKLGVEPPVAEVQKPAEPKVATTPTEAPAETGAKEGQEKVQ